MLTSETIQTQPVKEKKPLADLQPRTHGPHPPNTRGFLGVITAPGREVAKDPIRIGLLSSLFAKTNHRWLFSCLASLKKTTQRCPLAPGQPQPSSRGTRAPRGVSASQSQAPAPHCPAIGPGSAWGLLTHLHADLANGPGGIVADRDELGVQVGAQDGHELSWRGKRGVLSRRPVRVSSQTWVGRPPHTL